MPRASKHRRRSALWLLGCLSYCSSAHAEAVPPRIFLGWQVPPAAGCIPAQALEHDVEGMLGRAVFVERADADVTLRGTIARGAAEDSWLAVLRVGDSADQREISAEGECSQLNRALSVVVATLVDTLDARTAPGATLAMGLTLNAALGMLPHAAVGGGVVAWLAFAPERLALRARFAGFPPQQLTSANVVTHFEALAAELSVCPLLVTQGAVRLAACAGVEVAALRGRGTGLTDAHGPVRLLTSLPFVLSLSLRLLPGAAVQLELGPTLTAVRPAFYYEDADNQPQVVHRVAHWGAGARLGFIADVF